MDVVDAVIAHDLQLATHGGVHGGAAGIRDAGMLESALMRPRNLWEYGETPPTLGRLAAAYAFGISANHPFVDGNKRTALVVSFAFLDTNGVAVTASQEDAYRTFLGLAAGEVSEAQLSEWFEGNTGPLKV
jgi:death-on-curing protein